MDQPLIDQLPDLVLVNWAVAYCQSRSSQVDLQLVTLKVLEHLFAGLAVTYGVDFCGHFVCRRCLARFKSCRLRGSDAALHRYLTCILHKTANEGDNDTCHRATSNDTLRSKMRVPPESQVSSSLAVRGVCPLLLPSCGPAQTQGQDARTSTSGVFRSGVDSERKASGWGDQSVGQVAKVRRTELGASVVSQGVHAHVDRVPSPPPFWRPFVPTSSPCPVAPLTSYSSSPRACPATPCASCPVTPSVSGPTTPLASHPVTPRAPSPFTSPSSARTVSPYVSSPDLRLSPWSDCSVRSTPSLFDTELYADLRSPSSGDEL